MLVTYVRRTLRLSHLASEEGKICTSKEREYFTTNASTIKKRVWDLKLKKGYKSYYCKFLKKNANYQPILKGDISFDPFFFFYLYYIVFSYLA
jgi:hypothetical protein